MKKLLVDSGKRMLHSRLTVETWGNISCLREGKACITPSGMDYNSVCENDMIVTDLDGNILDGARKPSIELGLHLAVYRARPDVKAVVHTHAIFSNVFACTGEDIPLFHDEGAQALGDVVRCASYALPGTPELAQACVAALGNQANACLLRNHGAVCVGPDMDSAFKVAAVLEMVAELYYRIRAMGSNYVPISPENINAMQEFVKTSYGQK